MILHLCIPKLLSRLIGHLRRVLCSNQVIQVLLSRVVCIHSHIVLLHSHFQCFLPGHHVLVSRRFSFTGRFKFRCCRVIGGLGFVSFCCQRLRVLHLLLRPGCNPPTTCLCSDCNPC